MSVKDLEVVWIVGWLVGLWCDVGPETYGGPLAPRFCHLAIHHFCILSLVAWLSDI
jgi:hypothetical protein